MQQADGTCANTHESRAAHLNSLGPAGFESLLARIQVAHAQVWFVQKANLESGMQHILYGHGTPVTLIALLSLAGQMILLLQKMDIMQSMAPFASYAGMGASRYSTGDCSNRVPGLAGWSRPAPSRD